jgi:hypothetical protein
MQNANLKPQISKLKTQITTDTMFGISKIEYWNLSVFALLRRTSFVICCLKSGILIKAYETFYRIVKKRILPHLPGCAHHHDSFRYAHCADFDFRLRD